MNTEFSEAVRLPLSFLAREGSAAEASLPGSIVRCGWQFLIWGIRKYLCAKKKKKIHSTKPFSYCANLTRSDMLTLAGRIWDSRIAWEVWNRTVFPFRKPGQMECSYRAAAGQTKVWAKLCFECQIGSSSDPSRSVVREEGRVLCTKANLNARCSRLNAFLFLHVTSNLVNSSTVSFNGINLLPPKYLSC